MKVGRNLSCKVKLLYNCLKKYRGIQIQLGILFQKRMSIILINQKESNQTIEVPRDATFHDYVQIISDFTLKTYQKRLLDIVEQIISPNEVQNFLQSKKINQTVLGEYVLSYQQRNNRKSILFMHKNPSQTHLSKDLQNSEKKKKISIDFNQKANSDKGNLLNLKNHSEKNSGLEYPVTLFIIIFIGLLY